MFSDINTIAGARIFIANYNDGAIYGILNFAAYEWIEVGGIETIFEYGESADEIEKVWAGSSRTHKAKGSRNAGGGDLVCANWPNDAGQERIKEAAESYFEYPIKVVYDDKKTALGEGAIDYFRAIVTSSKRNGGAADDPDRITFSLAINSPIKTAAATEPDAPATSGALMAETEDGDIFVQASVSGQLFFLRAETDGHD